MISMVSSSLKWICSKLSKYNRLVVKFSQFLSLPLPFISFLVAFKRLCVAGIPDFR